MTVMQSIILGIIQGISEFLPISSSGHLVMAPYIFGWEFTQEESLIFDVRSLFKDDLSRLGWFLLLATIPAIVIALIFKDELERSFSNPDTVSAFLFATSILIIIGEIFGKRQRSIKDIVWRDALTIGIFQAIALIPGLSRSGSTISVGLFRNFDRDSAARFSFLMSVPVMIAAGTVALVDLIRSPLLLAQLPVYIPGFITSAVVGYLAIKWLLKYLAHQSLLIFAAYCAFAGTILVVLRYG